MNKKHGTRKSLCSLEKGMVVILALFVILVLTSVSLAALQSVANNLARSSAYRVATVAQGVAMAGSEGTMSLAATNPSGFSAFVAAQRFRVTMLDVSPAFFDTSANGSFGVDLQNVGGVNWVSTLSFVGISHRLPGYAVGEFCFDKFLSTTDGTYGNPSVVNPDDVIRSSQKRVISVMHVGPVKCP
jgi:hypothetical protein